MEDDTVRINKWLSNAGVCSRREADRLLQAGEISVDGSIAVTGMRISPDAVVCVKGKPVAREEKKVLLMLNKPRGVVCTAEKKEKNNVIRFLNYPMRVYPVGRLDKDSEGLLLLTNKGELVNRLMRSGNYHEKEYLVTVNREITEAFLESMRRGVPILNTVTRPCVAEKTGAYTFRIILTQGLNRQIRRMCEYLGYEVKKLKRIRIMNLKLGSLPTGQYREITGGELAELNRILGNSSSLSWKEQHGKA